VPELSSWAFYSGGGSSRSALVTLLPSNAHCMLYCISGVGDPETCVPVSNSWQTGLDCRLLIIVVDPDRVGSATFPRIGIGFQGMPIRSGRSGSVSVPSTFICDFLPENFNMLSEILNKMITLSLTR
jgi:hypothetical protein